MLKNNLLERRYDSIERVFNTVNHHRRCSQRVSMYQQFGSDIDWDAHRETAADLIIEQVEKFAPGFNQSVLGRQVLSPP